MKTLCSFFLILALTTIVSAKTKVNSSKNSAFQSPVIDSYYGGFEYELQTSFSGASLNTYKSGGSNITEIDAEVSLSKLIKNNIQAGGYVHLRNLSGGDSYSFLEFLGFGVYNFDNDLKQSLYAKAGLGMLNVLNDKFKNESKLAIMFGGGKRILVLEKFTYNPEVRVTLVDGATRIQLMFLNFSLLF
ncbi:MAG: hypothetical protein L6Q37_01740 [Bdellovibrionaceae bacterium]|nr:hypothetical protein [Pseudobdellovibrionaceae bacterium]NUM57164.1 hypothetical protein [Pseudobdellovibrionaceae bacterium]